MSFLREFLKNVSNHKSTLSHFVGIEVNESHPVELETQFLRLYLLSQV